MNTVTLHLTPQRLATIDALCKRYSVTRSDILQQALEHYLADARRCYAVDLAIREALPI